jgi:hypothetical protein
MSADPTVGAGWCFGADGADDLGGALNYSLGSLEARPQLLALGEPMHQEEEFPRLRNQVFKQLVEHACEQYTHSAALTDTEPVATTALPSPSHRDLSTHCGGMNLSSQNLRADSSLIHRQVLN